MKKNKNDRALGILAPLTCLPGQEGVGTFGKEAYQFVDLLSSHGIKIWQILPLNPIGYGHSPYQPYSSFALDEQFISLEGLYEEGLLSSFIPFPSSSDRIDYEAMHAYKRKELKKVFLQNKEKAMKEIEHFKKEKDWAEAWGVFSALHHHYQTSWEHWLSPRPYSKEIQEEALFEIYLQVLAYRQYEALHRYAKKKDVLILGDLPFYVGFDSLDVWMHEGQFLLTDDHLSPAFVAGVPPDYFSATGQRWGNPIYDWDKMKKDGFSFLKNRLIENASIYDLLRLDHFRAFDTFWKIPSSSPDAVTGEWIGAPGKEFFQTLFLEKPSLQKRLVAEDLGLLRKEVLELRDEFAFPGMDVIQFTFEDAEIQRTNPWNEENSVCYLGTHDNAPTRAFFEALEKEKQEEWLDALKEKGFQKGTPVERLIAYGLQKKAKWFILSLPDLLEEGIEARINEPSTLNSINWTYRISDWKKVEEKLNFWQKAFVASGRLA